MRYEEETVESLAELLKLLENREQRLATDLDRASSGGILKAPIWYRGLTASKYDLETSMWLKKAIEFEISMMDRFKQNASEFLDRLPRDDWEWLFLMRHHGAPSRLLDWSESALIGMFFAVTPVTRTAVDHSKIEANKKVEGALWCLLPAELNRQSNFGSTYPPNTVPMFEVQNEFTLYLPLSVSGPKASRPPVAGIAPRQNRRIRAQHGVFTIAHHPETAVNKVGDQEHIWRFTIPGPAKEGIRDELRRFGITPLTVFPDLDNVAAAAEDIART